MTGRRLLLHGTVLFLLPIIVAVFGLSPLSAVLLVLLMLLWRWMIALSVFAAPVKCPELELETISASHYVEKVRWCMDRMGVDYSERTVGGTLGAFFLGRTVPVLHFTTGAARSSIGNSAEILRYLWGRYEADESLDTDFLRATPERLDFEARLDRVGRNLQVWVYYHLLRNPQLNLHAWGVNHPSTPAWQKVILRATRPVLSWLIRWSFRITPANYEKSVVHIQNMLDECEANLSDGRRSLLGGDEINYTDICFAALMGLWYRPEGYGGLAGAGVAIAVKDLAPEARECVLGWKESYPLCSEFIQNLYQQRAAAPGADASN